MKRVGCLLQLIETLLMLTSLGPAGSSNKGKLGGGDKVLSTAFLTVKYRVGKASERKLSSIHTHPSFGTYLAFHH